MIVILSLIYWLQERTYHRHSTIQSDMKSVHVFLTPKLDDQLIFGSTRK